MALSAVRHSKWQNFVRWHTGRAIVAASVLTGTKKMETIKVATLSGVHIRQAQRNVIPDSRLRQTLGETFGHTGEEGWADRGSWTRGHVHHRRDRQLCLWNRDEIIVGRGERVSPNGQRDLRHPLESDTEVQDEGMREWTVRFTRLRPSGGRGERVLQEDHYWDADVQEGAQYRQAWLYEHAAGASEQSRESEGY